MRISFRDPLMTTTDGRIYYIFQEQMMVQRATCSSCFKCSSMCSEEVVVLFEANKNPRLPPWLLVGRDILEMLPHSYVLHTKSPKWLEILYIWLYITFSSCSLKYLKPIASHKFSSSMLVFFSYFISIYLSPHKIFQDFWFLSSCL